MADLLLETQLDDEQREYVNAARLCAESLFEILNAALEYSSLEAGQFSLEESEFSLQELFESAINQHVLPRRGEGLAAGFGVRVRVCRKPSWAMRRGSASCSATCSANAIKFTHTGSVELRVSVERRPGANRLRMDVRDTGIGIPPEQLQTIFESFRQGESGFREPIPGWDLVSRWRASWRR